MCIVLFRVLSSYCFSLRSGASTDRHIPPPSLSGWYCAGRKWPHHGCLGNTGRSHKGKSVHISRIGHSRHMWWGAGLWIDSNLSSEFCDICKQKAEPWIKMIPVIKLSFGLQGGLTSCILLLCEHTIAASQVNVCSPSCIFYEQNRIMISKTPWEAKNLVQWVYPVCCIIYHILKTKGVSGARTEVGKLSSFIPSIWC